MGLFQLEEWPSGNTTLHLKVFQVWEGKGLPTRSRGSPMLPHPEKLLKSRHSARVLKGPDAFASALLHCTPWDSHNTSFLWSEDHCWPFLKHQRENSAHINFSDSLFLYVRDYWQYPQNTLYCFGVSFDDFNQNHLCLEKQGMNVSMEKGYSGICLQSQHPDTFRHWNFGHCWFHNTAGSWL